MSISKKSKQKTPFPTLVITVPSDGMEPKLGYLSISSYSPFLDVNGKMWTSIEHYLLGKKFEGTLLEDKIRRTTSIQTARLLAQPRYVLDFDDDSKNSAVIKYTTVYDPNNLNLVNVNTEKVPDKVSNKLLTEKFNQHPSLKTKLLSTNGISISDPFHPEAGKILENLRDKFVLQSRVVPRQHLPRIKTNVAWKDIDGGAITTKEKAIIDGILRIIIRIATLENLSKIYMEMVDDAFINIFATHGPELLDILKEWLSQISSSWDSVMTKMPNFETMVKHIQTSVEALKIDVNNGSLQVALILAALIRWLRLDNPSFADSLLDKITNLKDEEIVLPPHQRWYRRKGK